MIASSLYVVRFKSNRIIPVLPLFYHPFRRALSSSSRHLVRHLQRPKSNFLPRDNDLQQPFPVAGIPRVRAFGFRELGVRETLVGAVQSAFPDVGHPTLSQAEFIPAILDGKDILLQDETGTGKSFGILLALLSKPRIRTPRIARRAGNPRITSLVIVPHRDLGFQLLHWVENIVKNEREEPSPSFASTVQLVVRDENTPIEEQILALRTTPPHILIGTPQALWDIYTLDSKVLQLDTLTTIAADEADYLLDVPAPYVMNTKKSSAWKNFRKHPSLTRQLLEATLPERKPGALKLGEFDDEEHIGSHWKNKMRESSGLGPLQVIMSSATLHSNLRQYLVNARWLSDGWVHINGEEVLERNSHILMGKKAEVVHHAFIVTKDGRLSNVEFAVKANGERHVDGSNSQTSMNVLPETSSARSKGKTSAVAKNHSVLKPGTIEVIAMFFAVDVPKLALLVLPPNTPVHLAVIELQKLGVNAMNFDLRSEEVTSFSGRSGVKRFEDEPTLLVASPSSTRGVDLPELTHVFLIGVPDDGDVDVFKHVAGRVDRFGRGGKVVTFLNEPGVENKNQSIKKKEGVKKNSRTSVESLRDFYQELGKKPVWFDFDSMELPTQ